MYATVVLLAAVLNSTTNGSTAAEIVPATVAPAYSLAYRVVPLGGGARAVVHPLEEDEWHVAIAASLIQHGARKQFTASQWLQSESLPSTMKGQVFTVAPLPDGAMASVAWMDSKHNVHADLILLDRAWHARSHFEIPGGVRDVIAGPNGTLLVVTFDAARQERSHDSPMLAVYTRGGKRLSEGIPVPVGVTVQKAISTVQQARLIAASDRYYFLDPVNGRAIRFRVPAVGNGYQLAIEQELPINGLPPDTKLVTERILGASEVGGGTDDRPSRVSSWKACDSVSQVRQEWRR